LQFSKHHLSLSLSLFLIAISIFIYVLWWWGWPAYALALVRHFGASFFLRCTKLKLILAQARSREHIIWKRQRRPTVTETAVFYFFIGFSQVSGMHVLFLFLNFYFVIANCHLRTASISVLNILEFYAVDPLWITFIFPVHYKFGI
jgi:hypothetical protein